MCSAGLLLIASYPGLPAIRALVALSSHSILTPIARPNYHTSLNGT